MKKLFSLILVLALSLTAVCAFAESTGSPSTMKDIIKEATTENVKINADEAVMAEAEKFGDAQYEDMAKTQNEETGNLDYYAGDEAIEWVPNSEYAEDPLADKKIVKIENLAIVPMPIKDVTDDPDVKEVKITVKDIPTAAKVTLAPNEKIVLLLVYQGADGHTYFTQIKYGVARDENDEPVLDENGRVIYDIIVPIDAARAVEDLTKVTINFEKITYETAENPA